MITSQALLDVLRNLQVQGKSIPFNGNRHPDPEKTHASQLASTDKYSISIL
tara:strand:+ start:14721 stop:14873 length:153 start_codon:yes stop_codon:yes gene_type:complete